MVRCLASAMRDGAVVWPAIASRQDGGGFEDGGPVDVIYSLSADRFTSDELQLRVRGLRPAR